MNNRLIIATAGSGKTTFLVEEAMKVVKDRVLITTYTDNNADEIKNKFIKKHKCIPSNTTVQTWFSFLIQHGVKPYQGTYNEEIYEYTIKGMLLVNGKSGAKLDENGKPIVFRGHKTYWAEKHFVKHYFDSKARIYSDKVSKFAVKANEASNNEVINRISKIYPYIFIDEAQDLAGYDLSFIKLLSETTSHIILVEDPRQAILSTHHEQKHKKYTEGKLEDFILTECKSSNYNIDKTSLVESHRNNKEICNFSSKLYPNLLKSKPCSCSECRRNTNNHEGIFVIKSKDVDKYLIQYPETIQLRWSMITNTSFLNPVFNFGESKGKTFDRVLVYPTADMEKWMFNNNVSLKNETRAKFYVAITRARFSVAIVCEKDIQCEGIQRYSAT
jgi:DNA helicase-2/ATP-dependent DNA helicase PcrA